MFFAKKIFRQIRKYLNKVQRYIGIRFFVLGGVIGLVAGLLAVALKSGIDFTVSFFYGTDANRPFWQQVTDVPVWKVILIPTFLGAFISWTTRRFSPETQGHGIPEVMNAVATKRGILPLRVIFMKFFGAILSMASGFSVGRVGPTVLIGSALGSAMGQVLKLSIMRMKMLVGCGAAAGIAATFNAPIAGTMFALEIIVGDFNASLIAPIIVSAMVATVTARHFEGNFHEIFALHQYNWSDPKSFVFFAILGVICGLAGVLFAKLHSKAETWKEKASLPSWLLGAIGGFGIGLLVLILPHASGPSSWDAIRSPFTLVIDWQLSLFFLLLAIVKMFATSWSISTGASGGIFSPSILIGGSLGVAYGYWIRSIFPDGTDIPLGYALVGMGAFFAAVVEAPLTAVLIIFELTSDYSIVLPAIISCVVSMSIFSHFVEGNIYTLKLLRRGIDLQGGHEVGVLKGLDIAKIVEPEKDYFLTTTQYEDIIEYFKDARRSSLPVIDEKGCLQGVVGLWDIKSKQKEYPASLGGKTALELAKKEVKYLLPVETMFEAMDLFSLDDFDYLPVVESHTYKKLIGRVSRHKLLAVYKNALTMKGMAAVMAGAPPIDEK